MSEPKKVKILGMELDEWCYESCVAHVGTNEDWEEWQWATIYDIESQQEGKGHATKLLLIMKSYYENQGKEFGGSIALNERMARLYKRCRIKEYC